jgi:FixJ family two-component response regulator
MKAGAVDYLPKPFRDEELLCAVERALKRSSEQWLQRWERKEVRDRLSTLTPREFDVLKGVIAGMLKKQIAALLGVTEGTIKFHRRRVMEKLGVISVAELVILAQRAGVALTSTDATNRPVDAQSDRSFSSAGSQAQLFSEPLGFLCYVICNSVAVAVIDIWMSGMSGLEVQRKLQTVSPKTRVIISTANDYDSVRNAAIQAGAIAYFVKPFDDDAFLEAVLRALPSSD